MKKVKALKILECGMGIVESTGAAVNVLNMTVMQMFKSGNLTSDETKAIKKELIKSIDGLIASMESTLVILRKRKPAKKGNHLKTRIRRTKRRPTTRA